MLRRCSSGSKSQTVEPSSTRPRRTIAPALKSRASASDVLPAPPWPTRAMLRIFEVGNVFKTTPRIDSLVGRLYEREPGDYQEFSQVRRRRGYPGAWLTFGTVGGVLANASAVSRVL